MKNVLYAVSILMIFVVYSCSSLNNSKAKTIQGLDPNLIGYWSFDDYSSTDSSRYQNHGLVYGAQYLTGIKNTAINFEGFKHYVKIDNIEEYSLGSKTIMFWLHKSNNFIQDTPNKNNVEGLLGKAIDTGYKRDYTFAISNNQSPFDIYSTIGLEGDTLVTVGKKNFIFPNKWYHCALVIKTKEIQLFINGELVDDVKIKKDLISNSSPIFVGTATEIADPTRYFNGLIDELRIYDAALTKEEIGLFQK